MRAIPTQGEGASMASAPLTSLETFTLMIAALGHDVDHPGVNNAFMINSGAVLALRYNDVSVLENHHAATVSTLLEDSSKDVLSGCVVGLVGCCRPRSYALWIGVKASL